MSDVTDSTMFSQTNSTSFERYCCFHAQFENEIKGDITSREQMLLATKICFHGLNITDDEHFQIVLHFAFKVYSPAVWAQCNIVQDPCSLATTKSHIGYILLWMVLLICTILSNLTVIMAVHKVSFLRDNVGNYLISSLAFSDFFVGIFIIPVKIKFAYNNLHFCSEHLCRFYITTDTALFSTSITNLFCISIDRYLALNFPYRYTKLMTIMRCKVLICAIWVYGCTWGLLSNINWYDTNQPSIHVKNYQCMVNGNPVYVSAVYVLVFYIPAAVMAVVYFRVLNIARAHAHAISELIQVTNSNNSDTDSVSSSCYSNEEKAHGDESPVLHYKHRLSVITYNGTVRSKIVQVDTVKRDSKSTQILKYRKMIFKASKTVATSYGTFIICWFPVSAVSLIIPFCEQCFDHVKLKWFYLVFVEVFPVASSMVNPLIYAVMNKQYRRAYRTLFSKFKHTSKRYSLRGSSSFLRRTASKNA